jgi:hypothetical protein
MLFKEIIANENQTKHITKNLGLIIVKAGGTYNYH